jgi:hypothetical protein
MSFWEWYMRAATDGPRLRLFQEQAIPERLPSPRLARFLALAMIGIILLGIGLRAVCFLRNQSLWIDEAMLALNVVHRPKAELLQPLDLNQGAPLGYLLGTKVLVQAFGSDELVLRSGSFIAGVAGLLLFVPLAYQLLPTTAARLAIGFYAISPYLVGYCAEFKQYELDATITVLLLLLNWRMLEQPTLARGVVCTLAGVLAVWCSHPALFTLAATGSVWLADAFVTRNRQQLRFRLGIISIWATSFILAYMLFLRKLGLNEYLLSYWNGKFLPLPPKSPGDLAWVVHHLLEFFEKPAGFGTAEFALSGLAAFCAACGLIHLAKKNWRLLVVLAGPFLLTLLASGLKKYPFAGRLLLFAVPLGLLMVSLGAYQLQRALNSKLPWAGWLLIGLLIIPQLAMCRELLKRPLHAEQTREMLQHIHEHWEENDRLYVYYGAVPAVAYYHAQYPIPSDAVLMGVENRQRPLEVFIQDLERIRGNGRLWVLLAHRQQSEEMAIRAYLEATGDVQISLQGQDATVLKYTPRQAVQVLRGAK